MAFKRLMRRPLALHEILAWAEVHHDTTGHWPTKTSGSIIGAKFETWALVDNALRMGLRGLAGGSSLAQFLAERRGVRNIQRLPPLDEQQVLSWADDHYRRTGAWPTSESGTIPDSGGEKWASIDMALHTGARGLAAGSSVARLLAKHRGVRNRKALPKLTEKVILAWADAHFERTGAWPTAKCGPILDAPGETWTAVEMALNHGQRGMPGGSSLARLLAERRGARNPWTMPDFSVAQVLAWADTFHERTSKWPTLQSGPVAEAEGETWGAINHALKRGSRGLPGGLSLGELLARERGARNQTSVPRLTRKQILAWADAHRRRTGQWPKADSGPIPEAPEETWQRVDTALRDGNRGLRGGSSLPRLLAHYRGKRNRLDLPPLSRKKIVAWADEHFARTGHWPNVNSGAVHAAPGERWDLIDNSLRQGDRGLSGDSSLLRLLVKKRGLRDPLNLPPLTPEQILRWADLHCERTGSWPRYNSGPIANVPGETWAAVDSALRYGKRGLPGESSLARLLAKMRPKKDQDADR